MMFSFKGAIMLNFEEMQENAIARENSRVKKNLTETNFEVLSVEPYADAKGTFNTRALVEVDLHPELGDSKVNLKDRYLKKIVRFNRLDLTEACKLAGLNTNSKGHPLVLDVSDMDRVLEELKPKINIESSDVTYRRTTQSAGVLVAKPESLGYTGHVVVAKDHVIPEDEKWIDGSVSFEKSYICSESVGDVPLDWLIPNSINYWRILPSNMKEPMWGYLWLEKGTQRVAPREQGIHRFIPGEYVTIPVEVGQRGEVDLEYRMLVTNLAGDIELTAGALTLAKKDEVSTLQITGETNIREYGKKYNYTVTAYNAEGRRIPLPDNVKISVVKGLGGSIKYISEIDANGVTEIIYRPLTDRDPDYTNTVDIMVGSGGIYTKLPVTLYVDNTIPWITQDIANQYSFIQYSPDPLFGLKISSLSGGSYLYGLIKHPKDTPLVKAELVSYTDGIPFEGSPIFVYIGLDEDSGFTGISLYVPILTPKDGERSNWKLRDANGNIVFTLPELPISTEIPGIGKVTVTGIGRVPDIRHLPARVGVTYRDESGNTVDFSEPFKIFCPDAMVDSETTLIGYSESLGVSIHEFKYIPYVPVSYIDVILHNDVRWVKCTVSGSDYGLGTPIDLSSLHMGWGDARDPITEYPNSTAYRCSFCIEWEIPRPYVHGIRVSLQNVTAGGPEQMVEKRTINGWGIRKYMQSIPGNVGDIIMARIYEDLSPYYEDDPPLAEYPLKMIEG